MQTKFHGAKNIFSCLRYFATFCLVYFAFLCIGISDVHQIMTRVMSEFVI